jgi:lysozyme
MYFKLLLTLFVLLFGTALAVADDEEFSRQELFEAVRLSTPGQTLTSLPAKFDFPDHARAGSTFGIDVSHHNFDGCKCTFDWADVASHKVQFVYVKASQGTSYADPTFVRSVTGARDDGKLAVGAYHFLTIDDPDQQAANFLKQVKAAGTLDLLPSLDLEWNLGPMTAKCPSDAVVTIPGKSKLCDKWSTLKSSEIMDRIKTWVAAVSKATGRPVSLYTNAAWWTARVGKDVSPSSLGMPVIWVADYSKSGLATEVPRSPGREAWTAWQFTDAAKVHSGKTVYSVDASIMAGDLAKLKGQ